MNCPECGAKTLCKYTRLLDDGSMRRRRRCEACGLRFSTREEVFDFIPQGRDRHGRFQPQTDCQDCGHFWGGKCGLGHDLTRYCDQFTREEADAA